MATDDNGRRRRSRNANAKRKDRLIDRSAYYERDPEFPPPEVFAGNDIRILSPDTSPVVAGVKPRPTAYVGSRILVSAMRDADEVREMLTPVANDLGWEITDDDSFEQTQLHETAGRARDRVRRVPWSQGAPGVNRLRLSVPPVERSGPHVEKPPSAPDAWAVLQHARASQGIERLAGVGLDHVLFATPVGIGANPWHSTPWHSTPWHSTGGDALATYGIPGSGGRQPVAFVGDPPARKAEFGSRRPRVGVLDTGCGEHDWLTGVAVTDDEAGRSPIGYTEALTDPEVYGDQIGPLDGGVDVLAGHGTFIAGLIHQRCPDAEITPWRVVELTRPIVESDLVVTLTKIVERVEGFYAKGPKDDDCHPLDVLNLSMGYYHETPEDLQFDPTLYELLRRLNDCGTVVVCSAGNDATAREMFPAAFGPWAEGPGLYPASADRAPIVSVGAMNPNDDTVAMFSNTGHWVRVYAPGAALVSTIPAYEGGLLPVARSYAFGKTRESIDPDDFRGGFAAWSGTSFAAPVVAGEIAAELCDMLQEKGEPKSRKDAVDRAWEATKSLYGLAP